MSDRFMSVSHIIINKIYIEELFFVFGQTVKQQETCSDL